MRAHSRAAEMARKMRLTRAERGVCIRCGDPQRALGLAQCLSCLERFRKKPKPAKKWRPKRPEKIRTIKRLQPTLAESFAVIVLPPPELRVERVRLKKFRAQVAVAPRLGDAAMLDGRQMRDLTLAPDPERPRNRLDCVDGVRPCPWVGCRHHNYLDVKADGDLRLFRPDLDVEDALDALHEMPGGTCSLDAKDELTLEEVGAVLSVTRERCRQIEAKGMRRLKVIYDHVRLHDDMEGDPSKYPAGMNVPPRRGEKRGK